MNSSDYQLSPLCEIIFFFETSGAEKIPMNTSYSVDRLQTTAYLIKSTNGMILNTLYVENSKSIEYHGHRVPTIMGWRSRITSCTCVVCITIKGF